MWIIATILLAAGYEDVPLGPGDKCRIGQKSSSVIAATSYSSFLRYTELIKAGDVTGGQEMFGKGNLVLVEARSDGLVIKGEKEYAEVRVLTGRNTGKSVYVNRYDLFRAPTKEELAQEDKERETEAKMQREKVEAVENQRKEKAAAEAKRLADEKAASEKAAANEQAQRQAEAKRKADEADEARAADLLKSAKRWLEVEKDEQVAKGRVAELRRRFPNTKAAAESLKLFPVKP